MRGKADSEKQNMVGWRMIWGMKIPVEKYKGDMNISNYSVTEPRQASPKVERS